MEARISVKVLTEHFFLAGAGDALDALTNYSFVRSRKRIWHKRGRVRRAPTAIRRDTGFWLPSSCRGGHSPPASTMLWVGRGGPGG